MARTPTKISVNVPIASATKILAALVGIRRRLQDCDRDGHDEANSSLSYAPRLSTAPRISTVRRASVKCRAATRLLLLCLAPRDTVRARRSSARRRDRAPRVG